MVSVTALESGPGDSLFFVCFFFSLPIELSSELFFPSLKADFDHTG